MHLIREYPCVLIESDDTYANSVRKITYGVTYMMLDRVIAVVSKTQTSKLQTSDLENSDLETSDLENSDLETSDPLKND